MLAKIASFLTNELQPKLRTQSSHDVCYFSKICCFIPLLTSVLSQLLLKCLLKTRDFKLSLIRESLKNIFISTAGVSYVSVSEWNNEAQLWYCNQTVARHHTPLLSTELFTKDNIVLQSDIIWVYFCRVDDIFVTFKS